MKLGIRSNSPKSGSDWSDLATAARRHRFGRLIRASIAYGSLALFTLIAVGPLVYLISPAFRDSVSLFSYPPQWIPTNPTLENLRFLFANTSYIRWSVNTFIYATGTTIITLVISTLAGYAFARLPFPGRKIIFIVILATLMVPVAAILAPTYLLVREIGTWPIVGQPAIGLDTYGGLILPMSVSPFGVFMMRQFILTLPASIYEAAKLDGASEWRILRRIVLPMMKPALVVLGIFVFMITWASFLWPLVATTGDDFRVITVGIASLQGQFVTNWGVMAAASLLTLVPLVVVFLIFQKWFVRASMAGALKQ